MRILAFLNILLLLQVLFFKINVLLPLINEIRHSILFKKIFSHTCPLSSLSLGLLRTTCQQV